MYASSEGGGPGLFGLAAAAVAAVAVAGGATALSHAGAVAREGSLAFYYADFSGAEAPWLSSASVAAPDVAA